MELQPPLRTRDDGSELGVVDSLNHPQAAEIRQILTRSGVDASNCPILIDDEENISQALRAGIALRSVFSSGDTEVSDALRAQIPTHVPILGVAKRTCKKLFQNDKVSRVFATAETPPRRTLECLASIPGDIVVLDRVSIAGNIGAIMRTSLAMGVRGVVLLGADGIEFHDRRPFEPRRE
jgi:TrmH family RNA methyltransferase